MKSTKPLGGRKRKTSSLTVPVIFLVACLLISQLQHTLIPTTIKSYYYESSNSTAPSSYMSSTTSAAAIDIVSLTIKGDFYILFNNTAITSWIRYIQNIRSITFIGPSEDYELFQLNMKIHYPHLLSSTNNIPIRWVNQTHWIETYMENSTYNPPCPYWKACQQLIKLHVFELRTELGLDILDNILIVDSDTVWSREVSFVNETNGLVTYFEIDGGHPRCDGMDPINFTEAITAGPLMVKDQEILHHRGTKTITPFKSCVRPQYPNASGYRHIAHHMLFQYDIMNSLHNAAKLAWNTSTLWDASMKCYQFEYCKSRVAEYELYFSFVSENYRQRVNIERIKSRVDFMGGSAICDKEEMDCCHNKSVLLKGCHDHSVKAWRHNPASMGDMCCPR